MLLGYANGSRSGNGTVWTVPGWGPLQFDGAEFARMCSPTIIKAGGTAGPYRPAVHVGIRSITGSGEMEPEMSDRKWMLRKAGCFTVGDTGRGGAYRNGGYVTGSLSERDGSRW